MQNRKTGQNRSHNRHDTQPNVKYHTVRASLFAIIFFGFFLVGVLEIVEKGRGRDVAYDTHQRSSNIPIAILQRSESRSRHDRGRLDGGETKSYKNIVLTTNLLLDLGQDIVIPEEGVLLVADLDGVTAELSGATLAHIVPCIRIHAEMGGN